MSRECVFIDGVRTANARAHNEKGWFRKVRPDELLTAVYTALFQRNPKIKPEAVDAVFVGSANPSGMQNDIGRLAWLASKLPESVPSQTICNQCPSGMSATMDAARAIMTGEADIMIAAGVEDMEKVAMAANMDFPPRLFQIYNPVDLPMGSTAEKGGGYVRHIGGRYEYLCDKFSSVRKNGPRFRKVRETRSCLSRD